MLHDTGVQAAACRKKVEEACGMMPIENESKKTGQIFFVIWKIKSKLMLNACYIIRLFLNISLLFDA